jgi:hypothetical protein
MVTEKAAIAKLFGGHGAARPKNTGESQWHRTNLRAFAGAQLAGKTGGTVCATNSICDVRIASEPKPGACASGW